MATLLPRRITGVLTLLVLAVVGVAGFASPAQAEDGFRYWNYFHLEDGAWAFSQVGAAVWPFVSYGPEVSYVAGDPVLDNLRRYAVFYLTTSLVWDVGRALVSFLVLVLAGSAILRALRRAGRRAAFGARVAFEP